MKGYTSITYIPNRLISLIYKILVLIICGYGLATSFGIFSGRLHFSSLKFFTVQSNLLCFIIIFYCAIHVLIKLCNKGIWGDSSISATVKGGMTLAILLTMVVYQLLLAPTPFSMDPGETNLQNNIVHLYVPLMAFIDWLLFDQKGQLKINHPVSWALIPVFYLCFSILAAQIGITYDDGARFAYPFMNPDMLGLKQTAINIILIAICFIIASYLFFFLDYLLGSIERKNRQHKL